MPHAEVACFMTMAHPNAAKPLKRTRNSTTGLLIVALFTSLISFRLGLMTGCSSSWLLNDSMYDFKYSSFLPSLTTSSLYNNKLNEKIRKPTGPLPYKCGMVFFYHIPSTGGASINMWLKKYSSPKRYNFLYFQHWKSDFQNGEARDISHALESEKNFTLGMDKHVEGLGTDEWRIAHCHINSMYLNETEFLLQKWRSRVESQGCHMINTIMFRDPLSHTLSLHKVVKRKRSNVEEWTAFLKNPVERGLWATNLDFLLYNKARRNPHNATKEEKVRRAMEILQRHFDVVTVGDHEKFMNSVLEMTGWNRLEMPHTNTFKGELNFTKKQVENLQKLLRGNGDLDFMDAVRRRYNGYLGYLD